VRTSQTSKGSAGPATRLRQRFPSYVDVHGILFAIVERQCARWRADHKVVPDYSWGTLPEHLQKRYKAYDCDSLVPPVPDAVPTGPTETVRRGWNRTAGSRYEFAADGVTFESSGGI
jgi:hypothetical protein